jgi:7-carboxy-7-deazaguanine synthase
MAKGLRLTDLYSSLEGEGPRTGVMTTFIRFGGCNMRCPGWPCDTQYAIQPSLWKNDPILTPDEILERIAAMPDTENMCITGGEPTMQPDGPLEELASRLMFSGHTIDLFTNGSLKPLPEWTKATQVCVILDWKLNGSGESETGILTRTDNAKGLSSKDIIKFVVASQEDFAQAVNAYKVLNVDTGAKFSAGVAWGTLEERDLLTTILNHNLPWRLNVQVHKYIFNPTERQI